MIEPPSTYFDKRIEKAMPEPKKVLNTIRYYLNPLFSETDICLPLSPDDHENTAQLAYLDKNKIV